MFKHAWLWDRDLLAHTPNACLRASAAFMNPVLLTLHFIMILRCLCILLGTVDLGPCAVVAIGWTILRFLLEEMTNEAYYKSQLAVLYAFYKGPQIE